MKMVNTTTGFLKNDYQAVRSNCQRTLLESGKMKNNWGNPKLGSLHIHVHVYAITMGSQVID